MPITSAKINTPASLRSELIAIRSESLIDIAGIATSRGISRNSRLIMAIPLPEKQKRRSPDVELGTCRKTSFLAEISTLTGGGSLVVQQRRRANFPQEQYGKLPCR